MPSNLINSLSLITLAAAVSTLIYFLFFVSDSSELHAVCSMSEHRFWSQYLWPAYGFLAIASALIAFQYKTIIVIFYVWSVSIPLLGAPLVTNLICTTNTISQGIKPLSNFLYIFSIAAVSTSLFGCWTAVFAISLFYEKRLWLSKLALFAVLMLFLFEMAAYWGPVIEG